MSAAPAKVVYLVDSLGLSGKTKAMVDLIAGLDPRRYHAAVICFDAQPSSLYDRLHDLGVSVDDVLCPDGLSPTMLLRLAMKMRDLRPDVVHCYNPRTMLYGGTVARLLGVKATLGSLSAFACLTADGNYQFLPQQLFNTSLRSRLRNRLVSRLMGAIVTVSWNLGRRFFRYNGIDESRLRVVPYGVDIRRFASVTPEQIAAFRARHQIPENAVVIGSVGRLVEQKDYPTQLRAFALAARRNPFVFMLIVGDGPLRQSMEAQAAELGIADRVRFTGHCEEVPVAMRALEIFVLASKFEPFGVALLEAKAAGTAIVSTRVNEVAEILNEGSPETVTGCMVPPENPQAMADAFVQLAEDGAGRRALGERAARDAGVRHSLDAAIAAYQRLYDQARGVGPGEVLPSADVLIQDEQRNTV
jgi:glycosyltransferase involved in cell wall biosynthesis